MAKRKYPKISITSLIQRANDIATACRYDKEVLLTVMLPWEKVERLAELVKELIDAQVNYKLQLEDNRTATQNLKKLINECKKSRSLVRNRINNALKRAKVSFVIPAMSQKKARTAIAQDLNDLAVLCHQNRSTLSSVNFDFTLEEKAAQASKKLSDTAVEILLDREEIEFKEFEQRKAITHEIITLAREICCYGRDAFPDSPERRYPYRRIR